jgi:hypothetical protein
LRGTSCMTRKTLLSQHVWQPTPCPGGLLLLPPDVKDLSSYTTLKTKHPTPTPSHHCTGAGWAPLYVCAMPLGEQGRTCCLGRGSHGLCRLWASARHAPLPIAWRGMAHSTQHTPCCVTWWQPGCGSLSTHPQGGLLVVVAVLCSQPCLVFSCTARMRACLVPVAVLRCSLFVALLLFLYCVRMCRM